MADFKLIRPCAHCPFRTDVPGYLRRERALEIAEAVACGSEFPCHETTVSVEEWDGDGGDMVADENSQFCAGALIAMENAGHANQVMRIAERVGVYDAERLDMKAPVVKSLHQFVEHHNSGGDGFDTEVTCGVVDQGCLSPAGVLLNGFVLPVQPDGEVAECPTCGQHVCENCSDDEGVCNHCSEDD